MTSCSWAISHCKSPGKDLTVPLVVSLRRQLPKDPSWTPPLGQVTATPEADAKSRGWLVSWLWVLGSLSLVKALIQDPWTCWKTCFTSQASTALSFCPIWLKLISWVSNYLTEGTEKEEQREAAQTHRSHFPWKQDKNPSPANFKVKTQRCKVRVSQRTLLRLLFRSINPSQTK